MQTWMAPPTAILRVGHRCPNPFPPTTIPPLRRHLDLLALRRSSSISPLMPSNYDKIPLKTAGAYQLIDRETGEKFIVWGGVDDADSSIPPSQEVLFWKPPPPLPTTSRRGITGPPEGVKTSTSATENSKKPVATFGISPGSFGRLKAQKVKALIKKASQSSNVSSQELRVSIGRNAYTDDVEYEHPSRGEKTRPRLLPYKPMKDGSLSDSEFESTSHFCSLSEKDAQPSNPGIPTRKVAGSSRGWGDVSSGQSARTGHMKQLRDVPIDIEFFSRKSFREVGCSDDMIQCLRSQMFLRPSQIQAMAYGPILQGNSCIIADQSGSGKTLAYLAPVVQCLRQEEVNGLDKSSPRSPRAIILVPTAELASQVLRNCRSMARYGVPFRSVLATGGFRQKTHIENLNQELDVLIATPGRFIYLLQEGYLELTCLKRVILDEVDILFGDEGFKQVLESLMNFAPVSAQYLFVTATLPVEIYNKVVEIYPDCKVIMGPGMHRTSSRLEEVLVDCSGDDAEGKSTETAFLNKKSALLQLVENFLVPKTIVFCNKIETCRKVENVLKRFDRKGMSLSVLPFHAALSQEIRTSNMEKFLSPNSMEPVVLVCTDRASRGMDFANVDHVILFDFPRDPSEYVRRVGRTARGASGKGKAYIFVVGKQVSLALKIIERNKKGHPLHDLPSTY